MRFAPGRVVVHRHFQRDQLAWVRVMRVVSDDERGLLLWIAPGSPVLSLRADDGRTIRSMPFAEWITRQRKLSAGSWEGTGVLKLIPHIERGLFPFDGTWCDFEPDPAWLTPPALPAGWDRPRVYGDARASGVPQD
jgi:hypothetical protein